MKLVISRRAEDDLATIYAFLAQNYGVEAAERFRERTERALRHLAQHPEIGPHPGWDTRHKHVRFWVISRTSYVIYYETADDAVSIERVLDGRRDVRRIIEARAEEPPEAEEDDAN